MPNAVKADESLRPVDAGLFGAQALVHEPQPLTQLIQYTHRPKRRQWLHRWRWPQFSPRWQCKFADWHHGFRAVAPMLDQNL